MPVQAVAIAGGQSWGAGGVGAERSAPGSLFGQLVHSPGVHALDIQVCRFVASATRVVWRADESVHSTLAANERVDAIGASWTGTISYPVYFDSRPDSCRDGGSIKGVFPVTTASNTFHGNTGLGFGGPNFTLSNPRCSSRSRFPHRRRRGKP